MKRTLDATFLNYNCSPYTLSVLGGSNEEFPIKNVCTTCNNECLSDLDRELCSRSPLSVVAAKEIGGPIWQSWDIDENDGSLFLEGKPLLGRQSFISYPQLIFTPTGHQMRADQIQLLEFGMEKAHTLFYRRLRKAFWEHEHKVGSGLFFRKVDAEPRPLLISMIRSALRRFALPCSACFRIAAIGVLFDFFFAMTHLAER